jgi:ribose/xylose/arabinose/galactoside ABC-type transport system permease subunit
MNDKFFTQLNLTNILVQNFHIAVMTTAVLILMIIGGIRLSIGYQISVVSVVVAKSIKNDVMRSGWRLSSASWSAWCLPCSTG